MRSIRFVCLFLVVAALTGCIDPLPSSEDSDAKDCDASVDGNAPTPDAGVDAPPVNSLPVIRITSPAPNSSFERGTSILVTMEGFEADVVGGALPLVEVYFQRVSGNDTKHWIGRANHLSGMTYQVIWPTSIDLSIDTYRLVAVAKGDKWHEEGDIDITGSPEVPINLLNHDTPPPSVQLTLSTNTLSAPGPVTATWVTNGVSNCTLSGVGSVGTSSTGTIVNITATGQTVTLSCTAPSGPLADSETVTITSQCTMDSQCPASYTWTQGYCSAGTCKQRAINCGGIKTRRTSALTSILNAWGGWGGVQPAPDLGSVPITAAYTWVPQTGACSVISAEPFDCTIEYYGGNGALSFKEYTGVTKCSFDGKNNLPDDPTLP